MAEVGKYEVAPGQLDEYYAFERRPPGECRIYGLPSGREIKRIPVFNMDCLVGWGTTNESKAILGTKPNGTPKYTTGDTHHVHPSYTDGTYDGKYMFVNDKIHGRLARIRMDTMETDKITELPNVQGFHGTFPTSATRSMRRSITPRACSAALSSRFRCPTTAATWRTQASTSPCLPASMPRPWKCAGRRSSTATATSWRVPTMASWRRPTSTTPRWVYYEEMMAVEMDACLFFNVARIEEAVKAGKFTTIGSSKVPVVDGTRASNADPKTALICTVPIPKNPHGVNISPDGKYYVCSGKLSPTASVIDHSLVLKWFDGELANARDAVVAEPEIGLGPCIPASTTRAMPTPRSSSTARSSSGTSRPRSSPSRVTRKLPVLDRIDVHYQPGHGFTSMGETKESDGRFFVSDNKFSRTASCRLARCTPKPRS